MKKPRLSLRSFNNFLAIIAIGLGLYIALEPFAPTFFYWLRDRSPAKIAPYSGRLADDNGNGNPGEIPDETRIVIPSLSLNEPVNEGDNIWVIHEGGTWRLPDTSTPDKGSNTVIVGHRYYAAAASTFYNLDKLKVGEELAVYWQKQEYVYKIRESKIVPATAVEIEDPTTKPTLTLYTCHPIWTAKDRLVVQADLVYTSDEKVSKKLLKTSEEAEKPEDPESENSNSGGQN